MTLGYIPHAAPMQMLFYSGGTFPADDAGDAFVAMRGSWNRKPASDYEVVRTRSPKACRRSLSLRHGLPDGRRQHAHRPAGRLSHG